MPEAALEPEAAPAVAGEPVAAPAEPREAGEAPPEPPPARVEVELSPEARAERMSRLAQLLDGADQVLSATDLPDARTRWNALRREWTALVAGLALDEPLASRLAGIEGRIDARDAAVREARTRHQQDNLVRLQALCDEAEKLSQGDHLTLRDAERLLRDIRTALDAPGPLPSRQDQQAIVSRLKAVQSLIFPRVQDLREADGWERWANAGVQEALITRLESLREQTDPAVVAKQLQKRPGRVAQSPGGAAREGPRALAALQDHRRRAADPVRVVLPAAGRGARRQPEEERGALRAGGGAGRLHRLDPDGRDHQGPAGRVEDDWPGHPRP